MGCVISTSLALAGNPPLSRFFIKVMPMSEGWYLIIGLLGVIVGVLESIRGDIKR